MSYAIDARALRITRLVDGVEFDMDERAPEYEGYLAWLQAGGEPVSYRSLQAARADVVAMIDAHASALRCAATNGIAPAEMASWALKLAEARALDAGGGPAAAPMLSIEAAVRGVPLADIAARVLANAQGLAQLEAAISGTAGRHKDALRAMADFESALAYDWQNGWPELP